MIRSWLVPPDRQLPDGTQVVSVERLAEHMAQAAVILSRMGGHVAVTTMRERTNVPGEAVSVAVQIVWQDRTDARAQVEASSEVPAEGVPTAEDAQQYVQQPAAPAVSTDAHGEQVDESDVPAHLRGQ